MAKDPAVLFYTSDFLTGTLTMTDEHVGMYIRLLCLQHQKGVLTKEDMYYICKTYVKDVFNKFTTKNDLFWNERMKEEATKRQKYSISRRENVLKRYKQRRKKKSTYVKHMEDEDINENKDININKDIIKDFNIIWDKYPSKVGRKDALRHFKASVKTDDDMRNIQKALDNYLVSERVLKGFIQDGSTWFNGWKDWVENPKAIKKLSLDTCTKHPGMVLQHGKCSICELEKDSDR